MAQQMTQEVQPGSLVKPEIKVPPSDAGCGREYLPLEVILQHRSLSLRSAQVRTRGGRSLSPLSSMKAMVRRSLSAFF